MISSKSRSQVDELLRQLVVRFFSTQHYTRPEVGILTRKNRLFMNCYSFLGHEYIFFNAIVSCLIALMTLKSQKCLSLCPVKPTRALPQTPSCKNNHFAITFALIKLNLLPQNRHQLKCLGKSLQEYQRHRFDQNK